MFYFNSIVTGPVIEILRWLESVCVPSIAIYQTKCISWEATLIHRHRPVVHLGESKSQFQLIITCTIRGGYARARDLSKRLACTIQAGVLADKWRIAWWSPGVSSAKAHVSVELNIFFGNITLWFRNLRSWRCQPGTSCTSLSHNHSSGCDRT